MRKETIEFLKSDKVKDYKKLKRRVDWGRFKDIDFEDIKFELSYIAANIITTILIYEDNSLIEVIGLMFLFLFINVGTALLLAIPMFILIKVLSPIIDHIIEILNSLYRKKVLQNFQQYKLANGLNAPNGNIYKDIMQFIDKDSIALQEIMKESNDINEVNKAKGQFFSNHNRLENAIQRGLEIKEFMDFIDSKKNQIKELQKYGNRRKKEEQKDKSISFVNRNREIGLGFENNRKTTFGNRQSDFIDKNEKREKRSYSDYNKWDHVGKIPANKRRTRSIRASNGFLRRQGIKTNWKDVNKRKLEIGILGEHLVLQNLFNMEAGFNQSNTQYEHVSITKGDWLGYDIYALNETIGGVYIEVKTTTGLVYDNLYMSDNEVSTMKKYGDKYWLVRVYNFDSDKMIGDIVSIKGAHRINELFEFIPNTYTVSPKA